MSQVIFFVVTQPEFAVIIVVLFEIQAKEDIKDKRNRGLGSERGDLVEYFLA